MTELASMATIISTRVNPRRTANREEREAHEVL
jgi:hypothetical protein